MFRRLLLCVVLIALMASEAGAQSSIEPQSISQVMREDDFSSHTILIHNGRNSPVQVTARLQGAVAALGSLEPAAMTILSGEDGRMTLTLFGTLQGQYNGTVDISGGIDGEIPVSVTVMSREFLPVDALLIEIRPLRKSITSGSPFIYRLELHNLLTDRQYNVTLVSSVVPYGEQRVVLSEEETLVINTTISLLKTLDIPPDFPVGDFILGINASFLNQTAAHSASFSVRRPFYKLRFFNVELWMYLLAAAVLLTLLLLWRRYHKYLESRKRYHVKVNVKTLPKGGQRVAFLGKLAERKERALLEIDKLTTHCIVAGATGRGKSVVAQVIVEECLLNGIAVIVFDPTAQWSGMLRKCDDKRMLSLYQLFGMRRADARAFNGNVRQINHAREVIDIPSYIKPGEIHIFSMNKLEPAEIDVFVANTVRTVFRANFPEAPELKLLIVYDEVHRLLPRFGGTGEGFVQIERACREFRKWGVGVMLVSQVLADFVGEIKANINTEVQLRTGDEGDLSRIKTKYGEVALRSLIRAPVGTCMFENPAYNLGIPYFIAVRPILHATRRLLDDELQKYNQFNDITDDLSYQLDQLEALGIDIFDLRLELKLAVDKIKSGNFNMVEIYLEGLTPRIEDHWKKLGKRPKKRQLKLVGEDELKAELKAAQQERAKIAQQESKQEAQTVVKVLKFEKRTDAALILNSGAIVTNLAELRDALSSMDDTVYQQHVSKTKNDLAAWVERALGMLDVAEELKKRQSREDIVTFLNDTEKKKEQIESRPGAPPKEDTLAHINRLLREMEACLRAGDKRGAFEKHRVINQLYTTLPREAKLAIFQRLSELSRKLRGR